MSDLQCLSKLLCNMNIQTQLKFRTMLQSEKARKNDDEIEYI